MKIGPDVGSALAACRANETRLNIGQPQVVGPLVGADRD
jgi:hypothetical protein